MEKELKQKTNGLFIGSFDMFTNGHLETLEQALPLFDKIYVVLAYNPLKHRKYTKETCMKAIEYVVNKKGWNNKVIVKQSRKLAVRVAEEFECDYIIRGIRNSTDYSYEEVLANSNNELNANIQTIYFRSKHPEISSTMIREFIRYGEDVSKYLPYDLSMLREV